MLDLLPLGADKQIGARQSLPQVHAFVAHGAVAASRRARGRCGRDSNASMIYYVETQVDTSSTAHYRTFLKQTTAKAQSKEAKIDRGGSAASRAPA